MKTCPSCGAPRSAEQRIPIHEHEIMGIPVVLVDSAIQVVCENCNERLVIVPNQANLVAAMALTRIQEPVKLAPKELIFLRKAVGWKAVQFADNIGVRAETFSRWENGAEVIGPQSELQIRLSIVVEMIDRAPFIDVDLSKLTTAKFTPFRIGTQEPMCFELVRVKKDKHKETVWDPTEREAA
jgi:DNA-binding transcriptional regulator YiaG